MSCVVSCIESAHLKAQDYAYKTWPVACGSGVKSWNHVAGPTINRNEEQRALYHPSRTGSQDHQKKEKKNMLRVRGRKTEVATSMQNSQKLKTDHLIAGGAQLPANAQTLSRTHHIG